MTFLNGINMGKVRLTADSLNMVFSHELWDRFFHRLKLFCKPKRQSYRSLHWRLGNVGHRKLGFHYVINKLRSQILSATLLLLYLEKMPSKFWSVPSFKEIFLFKIGIRSVKRIRKNIPVWEVGEPTSRTPLSLVTHSYTVAN